jgi:signal transduction histidine kinase
MTQTLPTLDPLSLDGSADLQTVLAAWHGATLRLEQTHEALRSEVRRLTHELEAKNRELARKNRLADLGQMASHIAHEVRNSLVPVTLYLSLLRRNVAAEAANRELVDKIAAGFTELDATVNDLLNFTADRDPERQVFSIAELLSDVLGSLRPQFTAQRIRAVVRCPAGATVFADRGMIRRAILNLVLNSLDVMPDGGEIAITVDAGPTGVSITLADSGPGMSAAAQQRAFEPFFTTKSNGTGLGLSIVERIAAAHGGDVFLAGSALGGAAFTLRIPSRIQEAA